MYTGRLHWKKQHHEGDKCSSCMRVVPAPPPPGPRSQHHPRQKVPTKALRHENSEAVWNELSHYKHKCLELETKL